MDLGGAHKMYNRMKKRIRNLKIEGKMQYLNIVVMVGLGLVTILALVGAFLLNDQTKEITGNWMKSIELAEEMKTLTMEYRMKQFGHSVSSTVTQFDDYEEELAEIEAKISAVATAYEDTITSDVHKE